ncbi:metallophosphoesterase [Pseudosulfitobacter pseudonitzschiae]|uniref:metallophosphoesterase n=1 Tax=Pseudosulfitobacter pseudonitzschiae TaxID=1402135 RepID=UPI003B7FB663
MKFKNIDIVPDIHGDFDRLKDTLKALGYREAKGWAHDEGRELVFLGDLIGRGSQNIACLALVEGLLNKGIAKAIMGNHELNAILYHMPDGSGGYLRPHGAKETQQHQTFLNEAPLGSDVAAMALDFMCDMPLFIDAGGIRLVHAFWEDAQIASLRANTVYGYLPLARLTEVAEESTSFGRAVKDVTGGPQVDISQIDSVCHFHDGAGYRRTKMRYRWWPGSGRRWEDIGISLSSPFLLPKGDVPVELSENYYPIDAPLVVFGHYQEGGDPRQQSGNAICLDFPNVPCAYRFDGESRFEPEKLIII